MVQGELVAADPAKITLLAGMGMAVFDDTDGTAMRTVEFVYGSFNRYHAQESTTPDFQGLINEAMARMHSGMAAARMTGNADQDVLAMMIPHHQGAVDAAKAVLLYGKDPQVKRLAQEILTEQALEIEYLRRLQK